MRQFAFAFLLISGLSSGILHGQTMQISEPLSIRNDYGYELIGRLRDRILLFRYKFDEYEVQAYDNQLRNSWNKEIKDLDQRGTQVLAVVGGKNDFSVVYKVRRRGYTTLRIHKYDPGANLIDSMTLKDYGERIFNPPTLKFVQSEDRNCMVVYNTADPDKLESVCFRLDKMQLLWSRTIHVDNDAFEEEERENEFGTICLGNNGEFFLIQEINNRRSKLEAHEFKVLRFGAGSESLLHIPIPDFLTNDVDFTYDNLNGRLAGAGVYAEKNPDRANGVFFIALKNSENRADVRFEPFDDKLISILRRKDVADDNRGVTDSEVAHLIPRQDGGLLLVVERSHEIQRGAAAGRGFWREGMRMVVDFYYDDLYLIALQPDGKVHWKTVLHKKQYSQDDDGIFSSYFLLRGADRLRFIFNDEIKYENTCSEYIISPLGEFDRNSLLNTEGLNVRMRFRDGMQISASECLIPSEFRNKLRLIKLNF